MKKFFIRFISSLIFLSMILTVLSCAGPTADPESSTSDTGIETEPPVTTEAVPETTELSAEAILGKRNFSGETLTFYSRVYNGTWSSDLVAENTDGTVIVEAVYKRNSKLSELYGVEFAQIESGKQAFRTDLANRIASGDDSYQALYMGLSDAANAAQSGYLLNIAELPNIDLEGRWWNQASNADWSIGGAQYFATGDITHIDDMAIRVTFFNKDIMNEHSLKSLYDLVYDNEWTFEKYFEYAAIAKKDNGDGVMNYSDDIFGATAQKTHGFMLTMASGEVLSYKDSFDFPRLKVSNESDRFIDVVTYLTGKIADNDSLYLGEDSAIIDLFGSGRSFLWTPVLSNAEIMRNSYDVKFGIAPLPKYTADQEEYYHFYSGYCVCVMAFPTTATGDDLDMATFMVEAMAIDSIDTLTPAYYEVCLKGRYSEDAESAAMIDIISKNVISDYVEIFGWGGFKSAVEEAISSGSSITSVLKSYGKLTERTIQAAIDDFEKLK